MRFVHTYGLPLSGALIQGGRWLNWSLSGNGPVWETPLSQAAHLKPLTADSVAKSVQTFEAPDSLVAACDALVLFYQTVVILSVPYARYMVATPADTTPVPFFLFAPQPLKCAVLDVAGRAYNFTTGAWDVLPGGVPGDPANLLPAKGPFPVGPLANQAIVSIPRAAVQGGCGIATFKLNKDGSIAGQSGSIPFMDVAAGVPGGIGR